MQLYLKPYPYQTFANVPYAAEKKRTDGSRNSGFFDVKKYPGQLKNIPEIKEWPELKELIEQINLNSNLSTFGCDTGIDAVPGSPYMQVWSFLNLHFDDMSQNESEEEYFKLIGDFLYYSSTDNEENTVVEFITSPTNYHDKDKFKKGATPSEKTKLFQGWSLNCKVVGIGINNIEARGRWQYGMDKVTNFLT